MARPKSRTMVLAEALEAQREIGATLKGIDLRTIRPGTPLRDAVKQARIDSEATEASLVAALQSVAQLAQAS